jgi:hypothetical protein
LEELLIESWHVPRGASIRLFLADGVAEGLWVVEKSNWTGLALMWPRVSYTATRKREESCSGETPTVESSGRTLRAARSKKYRRPPWSRLTECERLASARVVT